MTMNCEDVKNQIVGWLKNKLVESNCSGFAVGVSGGVDSGLVSTLCAMAGNTLAISMPINQATDQLDRATMHLIWLGAQFESVRGATVELDKFFKSGVQTLNSPFIIKAGITKLAEANMKSRLRMVTLYAYANSLNYLVVGTGNKVEDYGVGFFTKYGDGGIDISPVGDLTKTQVRELAAHLGVSDEIINAVPTDGLWDDNRSDESQIGASYSDLEKVMEFCAAWNIETKQDLEDFIDVRGYPGRMDIIEKYLTRHENSRHKMEMPAICKITF